MTLLTVDPGFLTTVQDLGRPGCERYGVPVSGAMDRLALMAANALVGNPPGAAGLEFALSGPVFQASGEGLLVAAGGRGFSLRVGGRPIPLWMAAWVRSGESIALQSSGSGWGYLVVGGGIDVPLVMGSHSTYLRGGFGGLEGRILQAGDRLQVGPGGSYDLAGLELPQALRPAYSDQPLIDVVLGPQEGAFTEAGLAAFLNEEYALTGACDRMGYRLAGPRIAHRKGADVLSEGIPLGAVQVPGDGLPIVLMADRQTAGGYAKIGVVASASLPLLAQCPPGVGKVRFRAVTVSDAQEKWRKIIGGLARV
jgi:antagonist of KipI